MAHRHRFLESGNAVGDHITQPHGTPTDNSIPPSRSNTWSWGPPRSRQSYPQHRLCRKTENPTWVDLDAPNTRSGWIHLARCVEMHTCMPCTRSTTNQRQKSKSKTTTLRLVPSSVTSMPESRAPFPPAKLPRSSLRPPSLLSPPSSLNSSLSCPFIQSIVLSTPPIS